MFSDNGYLLTKKYAVQYSLKSLCTNDTLSDTLNKPELINELIIPALFTVIIFGY